MPSKEDHLEAAKLAKLVGSHLNMIDKFALERSNVPSNRIDINQFIAKVVDPNKQFGNAAGYVPEALVQQMVPDTSLYSKPPELIPMPTVLPPQQTVEVAAPVALAPISIPVVESVINAEVKPKVQISQSLENSFEKIANSLEKIVDFYIKSHTLKVDKKKQLLND